MKPTRTILCLATTVLASALAGGCVKTTTTAGGDVNTEPLTIDQAMQQRNWEPVAAKYENGDVATWSTGYAYASDADNNIYTAYVADIGTYFVNLVTLPYTMYEERGGIVSTGVQLPPSYTAVPPLPPAIEPAPAPLPPSHTPIPETSPGSISTSTTQPTP